MIFQLGQPVPPPHPAGEWNWVGAVAFFGAMFLAVLIYLYLAGKRTERPEESDTSIRTDALSPPMAA